MKLSCKIQKKMDNIGNHGNAGNGDGMMATFI